MNYRLLESYSPLSTDRFDDLRSASVSSGSSFSGYSLPR